MTSFVDFFIVQSPIDLNEQRMMENVFRVDSVSRLTKIIKSEHTEPSLKYSALAQLSVGKAQDFSEILMVGFQLIFESTTLMFATVSN